MMEEKRRILNRLNKTMHGIPSSDRYFCGLPCFRHWRRHVASGHLACLGYLSRNSYISVSQGRRFQLLSRDLMVCYNIMHTTIFSFRKIWNIDLWFVFDLSFFYLFVRSQRRQRRTNLSHREREGPSQSEDAPALYQPRSPDRNVPLNFAKRQCLADLLLHRFWAKKAKNEYSTHKEAKKPPRCSGRTKRRATAAQFGESVTSNRIQLGWWPQKTTVHIRWMWVGRRCVD